MNFVSPFADVKQQQIQQIERVQLAGAEVSRQQDDPSGCTECSIS